MDRGRRVRLLIVIGGLALAGPALAQPALAPPSNDDCMACHADPSTTRADGRRVDVQPSTFGASSHGQLACVDCHADLAAVKEYPHAETLARVGCATCHDEPGAQYARGIHARSRASGENLAATCADCHGTHDVRSAKDPASKTNHLNLPGTCGRCHGDPRIIQQSGIEIGNVFAKFQDSIHGRALARSGLVVAPNCSDCHGNHDIRRRADGDSSVARAHVPATCGKCHAGIKTHYEQSIHGAALAKGNPQAPTCQDCHTAHSIQRADVASWRLDVIRECGTCHLESIKTYRDTFHGQVTRLGFVRVAACADCHSGHDIQPRADGRSSVSEARLVGTCQQCHAGANAQFVKYDPHADRHDRTRNPALFYAGRFMDALLIGVFAFFVLHTGLWLGRSVRQGGSRPERRHGSADEDPDPAVDDEPAVDVEAVVDVPAEGEKDNAERVEAGRPDVYLRRIDPVNRVLHLLLMVSFLGLAATGLPLLFSDAPWASRLVRLFGDFAVAGTLHRVCAVILLVTFGFHAGRLGRRIFVGKEYDLLWGPESMVPQPRDFVELGQHLRWFFGRGAHPQFDQFTYWEKFDYWAVFWGVAVIGSSGLMLWFPTLFSYLVPGWLFNVALLVHGEEALLAAGFIFTIHFFHGHLRPEKLPMDLVIFTGRITEQEMAHERPGAFQRLRRDGRLERLMVEPPAAWTVTAGRIIGAIAVGVGLVLVVLILSVLLSEHG